MPPLHLLSCVQLFATPWTAACQDPLSFTISQRLLKFMSGESVMLSNHLISALPFCLQSCPASGSFPMSLLLTSDDPYAWWQSMSFFVPLENAYWYMKKIPEDKICYYQKKKKQMKIPYPLCRKKSVYSLWPKYTDLLLDAVFSAQE